METRATGLELPASTGGRQTDRPLTRQAITKHPRALEDAGILSRSRRRRENRFQFHPKPIEWAKAYLDMVSAQWDNALGRLKSFVEGRG